MISIIALVKWSSFLSRFSAIFLAFFTLSYAFSAEELFLQHAFRQAKKGDYIVFSLNKMNTLLLVRANESEKIQLEEITVPESLQSKEMSWKEWIRLGARENSSWMIYDLDLEKKEMSPSYSVSQNRWCKIADSDNFLLKLLSLKLTKIPEAARKRRGPKPLGPDDRALWQPPMIVDGKPISKVVFDAWRARWPQDHTELSGKIIEIYTPIGESGYPAYFPYWLEISGAVGKAKMRIIDSGRNMESPAVYPKTD